MALFGEADMTEKARREKEQENGGGKKEEREARARREGQAFPLDRAAGRKTGTEAEARAGRAVGTAALETNGSCTHTVVNWTREDGRLSQLSPSYRRQPQRQPI